MNANLITTSSRPPGPPVISLSGDFDIADQVDLVEGVSRALRLSPYAIVDMSAVTFADSAVLAALLEAHTHARAIGGGVVVASPSDIVSKLLRLTGLATSWPPAASVHDALGLVGGGMGTSSP